MFVPFHGDGIISQFEGYEDLDELDWDAYRAKHGNIRRLDRILRAEGKDPNRYKITKQADTVMLFFLFRNEELGEIFGRLGYAYHADTVRRNIAYYDRRTSHGSTLSLVTHAGVLAAIDPDSSWERFLVALHSDADDIQGGTTKEGIHIGVMSGTLDLVQRCYAGTFVPDGVLYFEPRLPARLDGLAFPMEFRGTPIQVTLTGERLTLAVHPEGSSRPVRVGACGDIRELCPGERTVFELSQNPATTGFAARGSLGGHMPTFQGSIFDVDGVLVDSPHEKAWRESLRELMESSWRGIRDRTTWTPDAFTSHVYQQYVSGKPRASGARAALDYFQVPGAGNRVAEYAQHKQEMVIRLIQAGDFTAYPDALRFVIATKDAGMLIADASSSKNAALFLRQIRLDTFAQEHGISSPTLRPGLTLLDYFDADVSGRDFAHGKPDPEIFLTATHELSVEPGNAIVIEDAPAGVQAAKAGGMAAIGVARVGDAGLLAAAGADLVVTTLDDVDTNALCEGRLARRQALCRRHAPLRQPQHPPAHHPHPAHLSRPGDRLPGPPDRHRHRRRRGRPPLSSDESDTAFNSAVKQLRATAAEGLPEGVRSAVGGPAGFIVDLVGAFSGINGALLLATIAVVALVLIITYRSPFLWLVPLAVIGIADQVASAIVYLLARYQGLVVNGESAGILRVLVFGAGPITPCCSSLVTARSCESTRTAMWRWARPCSALAPRSWPARPP